MIRIQEIITYIESIAPLDMAETWDHVGLMLGDPKAQTSGVVLSLDCTHRAIEMCKETDSRFLLTHHPLFFPSIGRIEKNDAKGSLVYAAIKNDLTIYSAHTNLDRSEEGVNTTLAKYIGLVDTAPMPDDKIGIIGNWRREHTFFSAVKHIKKVLDAPGFFINTDEDRQVHTVFVSGGAFDEGILPVLREKNVDMVVSGEIHHHNMLEMEYYNIAAVAAGHDATERVVLLSLRSKLEKQFPELKVAIEAGLDYNKITSE